jgi:hypothetical protein
LAKRKVEIEALKIVLAGPANLDAIRLRRSGEGGFFAVGGSHRRQSFRAIESANNMFI